jgi:hypothetical protein
MKKFYIILIAIFIIKSLSSFAADSHEISDIYIKSGGNNKYEAKIKAHKLGMRRSVLMIADKMGIDPSVLSKIPYKDLKDVMNVSFVRNEKETDTTYNAIVNYKYDLYSVIKLLRDYGGEEVDNKFYEYLILPIFKQKNVINIWGESKQWNKKWATSRNLLEHSKLLYPKATKDLITKIPDNQVLSFSYKDFIQILHPILFKNVMLAVCEFFTDINTGRSIMRVELNIITPHDRKVVPFEYQINSNEEIDSIVNNIINKTIRDYGRLVTNSADKVMEYKDDNISLSTKQSSKVRTILLHSYIYDEESLARVKHKLSNIKTIKDVTIKHDHDAKYKITIVTQDNDFALAENFYLNGLSFKKYGNIYNLIDVVKGN